MKQIGGRGKKAPYETTHIRVPIPIKSRVEAMIEEFRSGENTVEENPSVSLEDALSIAQDILKQKKSARVSMERLIAVLYKTEIKL